MAKAKSSSFTATTTQGNTLSQNALNNAYSQLQGQLGQQNVPYYQPYVGGMSSMPTPYTTTISTTNQAHYCIMCFPKKDTLAMYIYRGDSLCKECLTGVIERKKELELALESAMATRQ